MTSFFDQEIFYYVMIHSTDGARVTDRASFIFLSNKNELSPLFLKKTESLGVRIVEVQ